MYCSLITFFLKGSFGFLLCKEVKDNLNDSRNCVLTLVRVSIHVEVISAKYLRNKAECTVVQGNFFLANFKAQDICKNSFIKTWCHEPYRLLQLQLSLCLSLQSAHCNSLLTSKQHLKALGLSINLLSVYSSHWTAKGGNTQHLCCCTTIFKTTYSERH